MDYSTITAEEIKNRIDAAPAHVQRLLLLESAADTVRDIGKQHRLDEERIAMVQQLFCLSLLGFIPSNNLHTAIADACSLSQANAGLLAQELGKVIAAEIEKENTTTTQHPAFPATTLPIKTGKGKFPPLEEGKPLVIHEEPEAEISRTRPGFSLPFSLFRSKTETQGKPQAVRVETPEEKKPEKRVVHYSESRTPLSPFGSEPDFLRREEKLSGQPLGQPSQTPAAQTPSLPKDIPLAKEEELPIMKKGIPSQPQENGNNVIDLRKLS